LVMQMVNSLSSKLQIGSPMASMYLLGNPDHYTNLNFKVFYWKSYVNEVLKSWREETSSLPSQDDRLVVVNGADGYVGITNVDDYVHRPHVLKDLSLYDFFQIAERKK
ncbi:hypothetical protein C8J57DRAFT_981814, partial [Mycena rebaudengoi]